jgi:hypothetical protein
MAAQPSEVRLHVTPLDERREDAFVTARALSESASALLAVATELCCRAKDLRLVAREIRSERAPRNLVPESEDTETGPWFTVVGTIDGRPRQARYWPGRLDFDLDVLQRAEIVVAMGERFSLPGSSRDALAASLDGPPMAVLLTVMRAFSRVTSIDLSERLFGQVERRSS